MIFQPSTDIDSRLAKEVARVEQRESGVRVVAARMYRVPFVSMKARVTIQKERAFNVLEEFILRAALELQPAWTRTQIAGLLGLDVIFLNFTCDDLVRRGLLEAELSETVILTPEGKTAWERGSVPEPPDILRRRTRAHSELCPRSFLLFRGLRASLSIPAFRIPALRGESSSFLFRASARRASGSP